jgi:hypothetical protein
MHFMSYGRVTTMNALIVIEETVGGDGTIVLQLPPGKHVRIQVEEVPAPTPEPQLTPEEEAAADAEFEALISDPMTFKGLGLTAGEIARSPEIGMWRDREDMKDSVAWVKEMRRQKRERRLKRD